MPKVGVIGYGLRIRCVIKLMRELDPEVEITAIADPRSTEELKKDLKEGGCDPSIVTFYNDADEMFDKEQLDGVMVGTRCSLHTKMGMKVLKRNLPLFLEKPVATSMEDLLALRDTAEKSKSLCVIGFPLRMTPMVQLAKEIIDSGKIGTVEHAQAWNNVSYGQVYYQWWYRDESETNGLFLQKATHDFDYVNYLLGLEPRWISAMTSKQIYKGDMPAGLHCKDCAKKQDCTDSPYNPFMGTSPFATPDMYDKIMCSFAEDTGNEDSGSALVEYETGMHLAYSQNFFARQKAAARGARLLGYKGTLEFDWCQDELKVFMHHTPRVESYKLDSASMSHGGGDHVLVKNFAEILKGEATESISPLPAGLLSVLMCLKAKESAATRTFQEVRYPDR
jgi:predicted dehydrogenase